MSKFDNFPQPSRLSCDDDPLIKIGLILLAIGKSSNKSKNKK